MNYRPNTPINRTFAKLGDSPASTEWRSGLGRLTVALLLFVAVVSPIVLPGVLGTASAKPKNAQKYKRIVALTPFAANSMALMGVFPKAIGQTLGGDRRYVSGLRNSRVLPLKHDNGPNPDLLIKLNPDLILSSPQWSAGRPFMESVARKVIDADPDSIRGAFNKVRQISKLIDRRARGKRLTRQMKASIRRNTRTIKSSPTVMAVLGVGDDPWTFMPRSWAGEIVRRAGGQLLTGGGSTRGNLAKISHEAVIAEQPEVIIAVPHDDLDKITDEMKADLRARWEGTPAFSNNRVYFSTDNSLLQAGTDIGTTIRKVRKYLRN